LASKESEMSDLDRIAEYVEERLVEATGQVRAVLEDILDVISDARAAATEQSHPDSKSGGESVDSEPCSPEKCMKTLVEKGLIGFG
jgi:hypothetical protein